MTRVCIVAGHVRHHTGGAEVQALRIATELQRRGYEVCYLNNPIRSAGEFPETEVIDGIDVFNYRCRKRVRVLDYCKIKRLLEKIDADVYYIRASPFNEGFVTALSRKGEKRAVWQCASGRSMVKYYKFKELIATRRPLTIAANGLNYLAEDLLRLYAINHADVIISQSEAISAVLRRRFKRDSRLILKGIRLDAADVEKDKEFLNVLFLRTIRGYSRHELFLEVAQRLEGHPRIRFSMAGRLARSQRHILDSIEDFNLEYLGFLPNEQALDVLGRAHILIDTMAEPEGLTAYNTSFLEAWSRRVAVLSFGSNPDNVFGRFNVGYKVDSVEDCVQRVKFLASHRDVLQQMGADAHAYVRDHHDIDDEIGRLIAALECRPATA
jgi:glycosyltransferase involved in cell wall biosynthesis